MNSSLSRKVNASDDSPYDRIDLRKLKGQVHSCPACVSVLTDRELADLAENLPTDPNIHAWIWAELWTRQWLYAAFCPRAIVQAIESGKTKGLPGFSTKFVERFTTELAPLRKSDDACDWPEVWALDPQETRVWGQLIARVIAFLEADGLIALIPSGPHNDEDGVALAFRFIGGKGSGCLDANGKPLNGGEWDEVVEELGENGPVAGGQAMQVAAVFPPDFPPGGTSIGLPVAIAWARRQARDLPLFSPLAVLATGELVGDRVAQVHGTGGLSKADAEGGAKGQLARRLSVKLYFAVDVARDFFARNGLGGRSFPGGTPWNSARAHCARGVKESGLTDSRRHLRLVQEQDSQSVAGKGIVPSELWSRWRRLGRLWEHYRVSRDSASLDQVEAWRRDVADDLGFVSLAPGFCDFSRVEDRHPVGELPGRRRELRRLDAFLNEPGGVLLVTGPVGHGKTALLTTWRRDVQARRSHSVFVHYFAQNDERLRQRAVFFWRLMEHLYLEAEEQPPDKEPLVHDVLKAWDRWQREPRRPLLLVIDGLDEAEACEPPFPDQWPAGVWLAVSCRSGKDGRLHPAVEKWKERASHTCQELPVLPLDIPSITAWLATLGERLKERLPPLQQMAAAIHDRTGGMALFVRHLLDDLGQGEAWEDVLDPRHTPADFGDYIRKQWDGLYKAAQTAPSAELALEILGFLIAARGALANRELLSLLGKSPSLHLSLENLPAEARRWVDVWPAPPADSWGVRFSLNHWLVREAVAPVGSEFRETLNAHHAPRLLAFCRDAWREGSPYALRHLPEHLLEERDWHGLHDLVAGANGAEFQQLQRHAFPDEPALALATVRRALETEALAEKTDAVALVELSLTHASLVHQLAQPTSGEDADRLPPLELAKRMTRLPVQWDPAATVMWQLVAAWILHTQGRLSERNIHLNALTRAPLKVPLRWSLLASALLPQCFEDPGSPWLLHLGVKLLPEEALADLACRLAGLGPRGWRVAKAITEIHLPGNTWHGQRARHELVVALAEQGLWRLAINRAFASFQNSTPAPQECVTLCGQLYELGKLGKDDPNAATWLEQCYARFSGLVRDGKARKDQFELKGGPYWRACQTLGQLAAWRLGLRLRATGAAESLVTELEQQALEQITRLNRQSGAIVIQRELAEAFAFGGSRAEAAPFGNWRQKAQHYHELAIESWKQFRQWDGADALEVLQQWLWLARTTFKLVDEGVWQGEEGKRKREDWAKDVKDVLQLGSREASRGALVRLLAKQPAQPGGPGQNRWLEPVEWAEAVITAIETLRIMPEVNPGDLAVTIWHCRSHTARAKAISRCIQSWRDIHQLEQLLACKGWTGRDRAAGWASWFRHAQRLEPAESHENLARYAARSILEGTARVHHAKVQSLELRAELAFAIPQFRPVILSQIASELPADRGQRLLKLLDLSRIATPDSSMPLLGMLWQERFVAEAKKVLTDQQQGAPKEEATLRAAFARAAYKRGESKDAVRHELIKAAERITISRSRQDRVTALCEVAEAAAACYQFDLANELFCEASMEIPAPKSRQPFGMKVKKVHPYLVAEWLSGLAKAVSRLPDQGYWQAHWSDWVQKDMEFYEEELRREPDAYAEACRAYAVACGWRALFDEKDHRTDKGDLWAKVNNCLREVDDKPAVKARTLRDLAILEAKKARTEPGRIRYALRRIGELAEGFDKDDVLHRIGAVFADNALDAKTAEERDHHLRAFLIVLPVCAEYVGATYLMLAKLVRLFPESAPAILAALKRRNIVSFPPAP